jgi:beta-lactamase regulating signal transducer with metallopeptidase domain
MIDSASLMQVLAWSLLHFLWQGAIIAALAAAVMLAYRKPSARYLVGLGALVLMLASFAVTFSVIERPSAPSGVTTIPATPGTAGAHTSYSAVEAALPAPDVAVAAPGSEMLWIARGWLIGVFGFALRIVCGLLLLEHLRRRNLVALPEALVERFRALQGRLGIRRAIQYRECRSLGVPAVIGIFKPIVLLPLRALTGLTPEQLEAVIAHELAHVRRLDVAVNFVQIVAETLFFFHPAVWWLNKRIRADREDCCDDVAIEACGSTVGYARALATMETWRAVPDFAMAATGSSVSARVARLLGVRRGDTGAHAAGVVTASLVLATALIGGAVSLAVANRAQAHAAGGSLQILMAKVDAPPPSLPLAVAAVVAPAMPVAPQLELDALEIEARRDVDTQPSVAARPSVTVRPTVVAQLAVDAKPVVSAKPASPARPPRAAKPPRDAQDGTEPQAPAAHGSFIQDMKSVGFDNLDVDQLIALRSQGVTPDYVREMRALGFKPDADEIVAMKVQGMSPEYVKGLRDLGINPDANELIAMKVQDITPEYVREIRSAGFTPDAQELIAMKVQDVTPEYHRALEAAGYKLDVSETIAAKVMGITPEFIAKVNASGFKNLTIDKLIQLKNADIL